MASLNITLLIIGMVIMGSLNTILLKLQFDTKAKGLNNHIHNFDHVYFQTLNMFLGEILCLAVYHFKKYKFKKKKLMKY